MLSVLRPAIPIAASGRPFATRFFVEDTLQTKKRRKAQSVVIPSSASAASLVAPVASTSVLSFNGQAVSRQQQQQQPPPLHQQQQQQSTQHPFQGYTKNMINFFKLMETKLIGDFLRCDRCFKVSDKYKTAALVF